MPLLNRCACLRFFSWREGKYYVPIENSESTVTPGVGVRTFDVHRQGVPRVFGEPAGFIQHDVVNVQFAVSGNIACDFRYGPVAGVE